MAPDRARRALGTRELEGSRHAVAGATTPQRARRGPVAARSGHRNRDSRHSNVKYKRGSE